VNNPWADEFERDYRTPMCGSDEHDECPHAFGLGGGFNPRRFRVEFGSALCACPCHAACPLSDGHRAVQPSRWRESCSCPGAPAERERQAAAGTQPPDFGEIAEQKREQSRLRREATQAVRVRARGKSRDQIREMLIAERRARGLPVPSDRILEANVEAIMGNYGPAAREVGRGVARIADGVVKIAKAMRDSGTTPDE
jgi:hypothetical protein